VNNNKENLRKITTEAKEARDVARETLHRATADAEHAERNAAGDTMTAGEKIASGVDEIKQRIEAEMDAAKRKLYGH